MKIGIIGAGNIGGTLGKKWASSGYQVSFGVREPDDPKYADLREIAVITPVGEAVSFGEFIVLAQPSRAVPAFAAAYADALGGKIIIDTTNDFGRPVMHSLDLLADAAPEARLARAFSTLGWENFAEPEVHGTQIDLFFCAHPSVRAAVEELITAVGLNPVYIGDIGFSAALDGMTRLWAALAFDQGRGRRIAFKLLEDR